ncbi:MAG: azurin [Gammaproteobacteria bacterium]|nr:azurin [Gammaproteobacteria bacterium]MBV9619799.1 azurin [Gammaproteobacteria bacterium]
MRLILTPALLLAAFTLAPHAYAAGDPCQLEISGNDQIQYDKHELAAPASCKEITVTLHHAGKLPKEAMGHDWVLVNAADVAAVANAGMSAGAASGYVPAGDKRVLAHTKLVGGGESTSVTFPSSILKAGGSYQYLCTFPGHSALMHGTFKFG